MAYLTPLVTPNEVAHLLRAGELILKSEALPSIRFVILPHESGTIHDERPANTSRISSFL